MIVAAKKWGNSLAVRIPRDIAQTLHIENDTMLELTLREGVIVIEPRETKTLESMVAAISSTNLHGETDTSESIGNEEW